MKRKKKYKIKKKVIVFFVILLIMGFGIFSFVSIRDKRQIEAKEKLESEIKKHYGSIVEVIKDANLYTYDNGYKEAGRIKKNEAINLDEKNVTYQDEYFKISELDNTYYIKYQDVLPVDNKPVYSERYKKYILFNENVVTNEVTNFYNSNDELVYTLDKSFSLPILIKYDNGYGVIYNDRLLTIKKEDVKEIVKSENTKLMNTKSIAVLNYHFFYDANSKEDSKKCNQIICLSTQNLRKHLDYIKNNNIFTPTMEELEMYIDKKVNLPKSVVLTIDDGWRADIGASVMSEYGLNATIFLVTKEHPKSKYVMDYIEIHSHGHNIHTAGACPTGQGGAIQCWPKDKLLADLKTSREILDNTTVFCYPFYEFNNYSIQVLKEAGFTMAFGGYHENGYYRVSPGIDKFRLPRYVIYNTTGVNSIKSYIG